MARRAYSLSQTKLKFRWSKTLIPKYSIASVMDRIAQCGLDLQM